MTILNPLTHLITTLALSQSPIDALPGLAVRAIRWEVMLFVLELIF